VEVVEPEVGDEIHALMQGDQLYRRIAAGSRVAGGVAEAIN
jgi:hypothetical protein